MNKKKWFYIIGILAVMSLGFTKHPFFLSLVQVEHNTKNKMLEVSVRIFADDFENNLAKLYPQKKIDINQPANLEFNNLIISKYISEKLRFSVNKSPKKLVFVGFEIQQESIWIYFETDQTTPIQQIDASCDIMFDYNTKQINILRAKANNTEKNIKLDYPKTKAQFLW